MKEKIDKYIAFFLMLSFTFAWFILMFVAIDQFGMGAFEAVGPAAVGGVFVKMCSDAWRTL